MSEILSRFVEEGYKEGFEEGYREGYRKGGIIILCQLVNDGILSMEEAVKHSEVTREEFLKIASQQSGTV